MLNREEIERYQKLDPANARLRALHGDTIQRGAWRLLWVPPSLPYYEPGGAYADPQLIGFTKRLVFSCWRVVPKAVSAILSYEAEREMIRSFRKKADNTPEARKKRRALLRFAIAKGRPTGMPVLGLIYPCQWLASQVDPLVMGRPGGERIRSAELVDGLAEGIRSVLGDALVEASSRPGAIDEAWYWALPLLLDKAHNRAELERWFSQPELVKLWTGDQAVDDHESADGWLQHIQVARDFLSGLMELGPPPADVCEVVAKLAVAGPGVSSLRALQRIAITHDDGEAISIRNSAATLAHSFLHLFNLPEVMSLLRDRNRETPYWKSVLSYCVDGNLQAVLDEYAHVLVESLGLTSDAAGHVAQEVSKAARQCLALRTTTAQAELFGASRRRVQGSTPVMAMSQ